MSDFNVPATGFWVANATDPRGAVIEENLGNGLQTFRGFDLVTGLIDSITTGPGGSGTIQDLSYAWDKVGNLTQRQDVRQSLTETFSYDNLHRLTSSTGPDPLTLTYDAMGNIQTKTGIAGTYAYHATKKHAVTAAGSYTFAYDANGNVSTRNGSTICWYSYNLPKTIGASDSNCTPSSNSSQFFYAPDRSRWKQVASYGGVTETTIYIGGLVEKVTLGAVTSWKHYIAGGSGPVAIYTRKSGAADEMHYLTRDHLGSVDSVTNGSGSVEVRLSYGPFGQRRKEAGWSGNPTSGDWTEITDSTRRGFTSHEMLDNLNLTHMNGRVYDQVVGRFISADPFIPEPGLTQSFNRYSYVMNNPLTFTDPSGFCLDYATCHWMDGSLTVGGRGADPSPSANWFYQMNYRNVDVLPPNAQPFPDAGDTNTPSPDPRPEPDADPIDEVANQSFTHVPTDILPGSTVSGTLGVPDWATTSGICLGGCHGTSPEVPLRPMTTAERLVLHGIGIVVTAPLGGEFIGAVRAGIAARGLAGLSAGEAAVLAEARGILASSELAALRAAHAAGRSTSVTIGGRTILYEPGLSASGMTLFGENGFVIGRGAFASSGELGRTVLHELYRLSHSASAGGVSGALAAQETAAAAGFAERAAAFLGL